MNAICAGLLIDRVCPPTRLHAASLILPDGTETRLRLDEVEAHEPARLSYMPDDLEHGMSVAEFRDLVAFLLTME